MLLPSSNSSRNCSIHSQKSLFLVEITLKKTNFLLNYRPLWCPIGSGIKYNPITELISSVNSCKASLATKISLSQS